MKIGILGTRGIPNVYGGFEQFAQYLAQGLVQKGHDVYVYSSSTHPYQESTWNGVHIVHCKDLEDRIGTVGQFIYDLNCLRDANNRNFDVLLQLGYTSNSIWHHLWPANTINIVNIDGLEWKRTKYNALTQRFLTLAESWAVKHSEILISDSIGIQEYISQKYNKPSVYIPYGAVVPDHYDPAILEKWELAPYNYMLLIARMEPENNIEMIIQGYLAAKHSQPLVIIGNVTNKFGQALVKRYSTPDIRFLGPIYHQETINNLRHYSYLYFHGHSVGGTNPSLLEAMACKCNIAAHNNVFNKAILGTDAGYFSNRADVTSIIDQVPDLSLIENRKNRNTEKIKTTYNWSKIIDEYEQVFLGAAEAKK